VSLEKRVERHGFAENPAKHVIKLGEWQSTTLKQAQMGTELEKFFKRR